MKKKEIIQRLLYYCGKYLPHIITIFLLAAIGSGSTLTAPYVLGKAVNEIRGIHNVSFEIIMPLLLKLLVLYIVASLSGWLLSAMSAYVSNHAVRDIRKDLFEKIKTLPLSFFDSRKTGELMSIFTNDLDLVAEGLFQAVTQLFSAIITIAGSFYLMFYISPSIAFAVGIVAPVALIIAGFISGNSSKLFKNQQKLVGQYNGYIEESISMLKTAKAFNYEDMLQEETSKINDTLYVYGQKAQFFSSLVNPSTRFINNIAYISVGLIGGALAAAGSLTVGAITSLINYSAQFAKPLNEITAISSQLQSALASSERIFSLIDEIPEASTANLERLENIEGNVKFENASFSYNKSNKLIENFSVNIPKGSMVAIVGPTGAGKTTMVNLLMRFYDLDYGNILIDGKNITNYSKDSLRLAFGMVLQDTWLFTGTIKDNIAYGNKNASFEDIIEAAKNARAHNFITRLKDGYDTVIGEEGGSLSQGEKQLIAIARSMLADSPMLILDEATSSVDPMTELDIQEALKTLMKGKTSFIIAHRLSTIQEADIIIVMDKGKIIETGSHTKLLDKKGFYYRLYNSQFINPSEEKLKGSA